jgi:hypothetical protein
MHIDPAECHPAMDYHEHTKTYGLFPKGAIYLSIGVIAILGFLYLFVV